MRNLKLTTTFNRADNTHTPNISEGRATEVIFNAFRLRLRADKTGRASGLRDGMHCDFEHAGQGNGFERLATLFAESGDVLATAILDEHDA